MAVSGIEKRPLGSSGIEVTSIGLGGNTLGPPGMDEATSRDVVAAAFDLGINFVDTSVSYGEGLGEEYLGRALGARRSEFVIATKFSLREIGDETPVQRIHKHLEASLRKLNTDYIDLWQIHHASPTTPPEVILTELDKVVRAGKVRAVGACNFSSWRLCESMFLAKELGTPSYVTVQNYYHLFARQTESEVIPFCEKYDVAMLPYHPLAGGFLTGKYKFGEPPPPGSRGAAGNRVIPAMATQHNWELLGRIEEFCAARGRGVGELAIAWLLSRPRVASVIAGVSKVEQLVQNAKAADWVLSDAEKAEIEQISVGPIGVPSPERMPYGPSAARSARMQASGGT